MVMPGTVVTFSPRGGMRCLYVYNSPFQDTYCSIPARSIDSGEQGIVLASKEMWSAVRLMRNGFGIIFYVSMQEIVETRGAVPSFLSHGAIRFAKHQDVPLFSSNSHDRVQSKTIPMGTKVTILDTEDNQYNIRRSIVWHSVWVEGDDFGTVYYVKSSNLVSENPMEEAPAAATPAPERATASTSQCVICKDADSIMAAVPCGHLAYCLECSKRYKSAGDTKCAVCRQPFTQFLRIFV